MYNVGDGNTGKESRCQEIGGKNEARRPRSRWKDGIKRDLDNLENIKNKSKRKQIDPWEKGKEKKRNINHDQPHPWRRGCINASYWSSVSILLMFFKIGETWPIGPPTSYATGMIWANIHICRSLFHTWVNSYVHQCFLIRFFKFIFHLHIATLFYFMYLSPDRRSCLENTQRHQTVWGGQRVDHHRPTRSNVVRTGDTVSEALFWVGTISVCIIRCIVVSSEKVSYQVT